MRMSNSSIGAAAEASGVKVTTIRFYETRGLLPEPDRTAAGRRVYDAAAIARLKFIRHARDLGFPLEDISALLELSDQPNRDCAAADSIAQQQLAAVSRRIEQLIGLQAELARMVAHCSGGQVSDCNVIESLADHSQCASDHKIH